MQTRAIVAPVLAVTLLAGLAHAEIVGGPQKAVKNGYTVEAMETNALISAGPDTVNVPLEQALAKQGFGSDNGWNLRFDYSSGSFDVAENFAWVDMQPAVNAGPWAVAAADRTGAGGINFGFEYERAAGDPAVANIGFVQLIRTNTPLDHGVTWGYTDAGDPGFTYYIDNGYIGDNAPDNPFYGSDDNDPATGYAGIGQFLLDAPGRLLTDAYVEWEAQTYLATWDRANKDITLFNGIQWGFTITVPTPGGIAFLALGGVTAARRRRS